MIGMGNPIQTLPISAAALREVDLLGVFRYADTYPAAVSFASHSEHGEVLSRICTHSFTGFDEIEKAFELVAAQVDGDGKPVLKIMIDFDSVIE